VPLGEFARRHDLEFRFIEFMPLDAERQWHNSQVLYGATVRRRLEQAFGPLVPRPREDASQPAVDFQFADGQGRIGFINSVSQPFCESCNRLRLTAEGQIRNCLFGTEEWDARGLLRGAAEDRQLEDLIRAAVAAKKAGHGIDTDQFVRPQRSMYQIGG
jgi:cyclic pyranopterin phosphate synthase